LVALFTRIVVRIEIFEAQWANGCYLGHVLTGLRPMEVPRITRQHDDATRRVRLHFIAVELFAEADVENARHDRVDSVFRMTVWHQFHVERHFDPDHVVQGTMWSFRA
jgi:hypothetical protein